MSRTPMIKFTIYNINVIDDKPTLGSVENVLMKSVPKDSPTYDTKYDEEVNRLLNEVEEELLWDKSEIHLENYDFPKDTHHVGPIPVWYQEMLRSKMKEAKSRLKKLSNLVCAASPSTAAHIKRIEEDHSTTFCKMDYPRHPPMGKPWTNSWKFSCKIECRDGPSHSHTATCQYLVLEDDDTGELMDNPNISRYDYPPHVVFAAKLFHDFAIKTTKEKSFSDSKADLDTIYDKIMWTSIKLFVRSNCKKELIIVVRGKKLTILEPYLRMYFEYGPGKTKSVVSVLCYDKKGSRKTKITGKNIINTTSITELKDKVGPISIKYDISNHYLRFNSIETMQLGKIIQDYMGLTKETTLLDFSWNFGLLSLIMAHNCQRVIGLNAGHSLKQNEAEKLRKANKMHNVSFVACDPEDVLKTCLPITDQCATVAILDLSSSYGESRHLMQALRDIPSIWRVIIYGSFADGFHENIAVLMSDDDSMGERYLPMQGCILDKSTSIVDAFDIVVLFERKSLIEPKIELLAPGPTLNVKLDSEIYNRGLSNEEGMKPAIYELPMDENQDFAVSKEKLEERLPSPSDTESKHNELTDNLPFFAYPSVSANHQYCSASLGKFLKPPLLPNHPVPLETFSNPSLVSHPQSQETVQENFWHNYPAAPLETFSNPPPVSYPTHFMRNEYQNNYPPPLVSYPSLPVSFEFQYNRPPLPEERLHSPPPPPPPPTPSSETGQLENDCADNSASTTVKAEPAQLCDGEDEKIAKSVNDATSGDFIKSELADQSTATDFSTPQPVTGKSDSSTLASLKAEIVDMELSPISPDIESMEPAIHNAKALSECTSTITNAASNVTVEGSEFPVQTDHTFLDAAKHGSEESNNEKEPGEISDSDKEFEEISDDEMEPQIKSKVVRVETKFERELPQRYDWQSSLSDTLRYKYGRRSPSPRRFTRSPSPRRYGRSPSPYYSYRRYRRSSSVESYGRSPSPYERRRRRSPSPFPLYKSYREKEIYSRPSSPDYLGRERYDRYERLRLSRWRSRSPS